MSSATLSKYALVLCNSFEVRTFFPYLFRNRKRAHLGGPLYDGVVLDNFNQRLALLLADSNKAERPYLNCSDWSSYKMR